MSKIISKRLPWGWWLVGVVFLVQILTFCILRENSYIGIHDNLDIHIVDQRILQLENAFFSHDVKLPLLGGINRNYLASEFNLYTILYMLLPTFAAYITGHFLKIAIALFSTVLLAKDIFKDAYKKYENIVILLGFTYGVLPLYPAFAFSFVSVPLLIFLIRKIFFEKKKKYYIALFVYPLLSYFTFFGIFLLGYLAVYTIYRCMKDNKISMYLIAAVFVLFLGYAVFEYRLFYVMLFGQVETIRETMIMNSAGFFDVLDHWKEAFAEGVFHANSLHKVFVMPICLIYLIVLNLKYIKNRAYKKIVTDYFNLVFLFIIGNCCIYALYYWEGFRVMVEFILPPLKGWQFTRTVFFNPFLWYVCIFIIVKRLLDRKKSKLSYGIAVASLLVVLGTQSLYNDFYNTVYTHAYMIIKGKDTDSLSYREFYSESLFERIKTDIGYEQEFSVAYGMHPAVLQYNGIATLDGCLSYYEQDYKEAFRTIIAPALEKSEVGRSYFDDWGARAYIFSATDEAVWQPVKNMKITDYNLSVNIDAFRKLNGVYIFSRIPISNTEELTLQLVGEYQDNTSPYTIYVYR